ncbi:MFS transporter [Streptomyces sp. NPDC048696]|uniref:MFS transporter n=1 Tax=Streptomyces sp. NPDC048696 TaxID=3365585 RepID=UPI0037112502
MAGTVAGDLAGGLILGTLPLAVLAHGGGPLLIGLVSAAVTGWWILAIPLGAFVDRRGCGPVLTAATALRCAAAVLLAAGALRPGVGAELLLGAGALAYGLASTGTDIAAAVAPVRLLDPAACDEVYALLYVSSRVAGLAAGPAAGAALFAVSPTLPFAAGSACLALSCFTFVRLRRPLADVEGPPRAAERRRVWAGVAVIRNDAFLRPVAITLIGVAMAEETVATVVAPYFRAGHAAGPWIPLLGALRGVSGAVSIGAALAAGRLARRFRLHRVLIAVATLGAFCPALMAIGPGLLTVGGALVLSACTEAIWVPLVQSETARRTPAHLVARTRATITFIVWGSLPLTSTAAGALAQLIGIPVTLTLASVLAFTSCLFGVWWPVITGTGVGQRHH